jgi:hypothetical protein
MKDSRIAVLARAAAKRMTARVGPDLPEAVEAALGMSLPTRGEAYAQLDATHATAVKIVLGAECLAGIHAEMRKRGAVNTILLHRELKVRLELPFGTSKVERDKLISVLIGALD